MEVDHESGNDVPAWFLDTDYNGLCFHVSQAFFPKTGAWENLKKALKGSYEESVWDHLAGTTSAPFVAGEHGQIAVKVIDQRGNELLVVKQLRGKPPRAVEERGQSNQQDPYRSWRGRESGYCGHWPERVTSCLSNRARRLPLDGHHGRNHRREPQHPAD